jgi:LmbE family N-acetylglucosaminyl deacetylase
VFERSLNVNDSSGLKIIVVAAHPDDEVLGCGGVITRLAEEGHQVRVIILGEGITSRFDQRSQADPQLVKELHNHSRKAASLMGVAELDLHDFPDNRFDTVPLLDFVKIIEKSINQFEPQIIYSHHGGDVNIDHVITHRAVMTATRPVRKCPVKEIYAFEVPSSTEWAFGQFQSAFQPTVFVDISATLETKVKAMQFYESEARFFPHPRSPEALRVTAKRWGSVVGLEHTEAFELIRSVR